MSLRKDVQALTDEQLREFHTHSQNQVAYHLNGGFYNLVSKYTKAVKVTEREIRSRNRYYGRLKK